MNLEEARALLAKSEEERRRLEDQLRQAHRLESLGRLAGGVAHDLNNLLTAIAGYTELALNEIPETSPARADVEEVRRSAERAAAVTRQLLSFTRRETAPARPFNLNQTVADLSRLMERLLGPNIALTTRLAEQPLLVVGDPGQIERAIVNLAVNARDAMPDGGQLTLETLMSEIDEHVARAHPSAKAGRYVSLRVHDTGHGMPAEILAQAFEPFFTTKDPGKGTGLGLSMVASTVHDLGGFVEGRSEVDRGTTFTLNLPLASPAPASTERPADKASPTLLIAEDEPAVRRLVATTLAADGYTLLSAASADEALRVAHEHHGPIDLLLTDARMPGMNGMQLARALRTERPAIRIVLMSGFPGELNLDTDLPSDASILAKPFAPRELRERIRDVLASP